MEKLYGTQITSPLGLLTVAATDAGVCRIAFPSISKQDFIEQILGTIDSVKVIWREYHVLKSLGVELRRYFRGKLEVFEVALSPRGTTFQKKVWDKIEQIPYGETKTYQEIADEIGQPQAVRAVGQACGANPLPIVIPCHRVVSTGRGLGGYSANMKIKEFLLQLEGVILI